MRERIAAMGSTRRELPQGTVTFLFTDIESSTRKLRESPQDYELAQSLHGQILHDSITTAGGTVVRTEGDAFFAVFSEAAMAVSAAVHAQRKLAAAQWPTSLRLSVRMGMHTGSGHLVDGDYLGLDVNLAARIAGAAQGGQVLVSEATRVLANAAVEGAQMRHVGSHRFKDFDDPVRIFQVDISGLPTEFPSLPGAGSVGVPIKATRFIGRAHEIESLSEAIVTERLVSIIGPGGIGKTRAAIEIAALVSASMPDGVYFADLTTDRQEHQVIASVAAVLGVELQGVQDHFAAIVRAVEAQRMLIILDNFEQVLDAAPLVSRMMQQCPEARFLVTSRSPLHIQGEHEFSLGGLSLGEGGPADAVELFLDRAGARIDVSRVTHGDEADIAEICRILDGMPLAIELAANQMKFMTAREIARDLQEHLGLTAPSGSDLPDRHRSLRGTIAWSYDLLDDAQKEALGRIAVFSGGANLADAIEVLGGDGWRQPLFDLVDQSLLTRLPDCGHTRFNMLEMVRQFAIEATDKQILRDARRRHAERFARMSEQIEVGVQSIEQRYWLDLADSDRANLRSALQWSIASGEVGLARSIGSSLWRYWQQRGHLPEGAQMLGEVIELPGPQDRSLIRALIAHGGIVYWMGDLAAAGESYQRALDLARQLTDAKGEMWALYNIAWVLLLSGDPKRALDQFERASAIADTIGDAEYRGHIISGMSFALFEQGNLDGALDMAQEGLKQARANGDRLGEHNSLASMGEINRMKGDLAAAKRYYGEALQSMAEARSVGLLIPALLKTAEMALEEGSAELAAQIWSSALSTSERSGTRSPGTSTEQLMQISRDIEHALGSRYPEALQEGRDLSYEEILAKALDFLRAGEG
ncbi:MAG: tetratricopeptide repeat protein [Actinobacteria bacterium]|nr:tetratricopeptide repeat protein [Actinomycetota bacterium]